jgi:hypothetical protein
VCDKFNSYDDTQHSGWIYRLSYESTNMTNILFGILNSENLIQIETKYLYIDLTLINFLAIVLLLLINFLFIIQIYNLTIEADFKEVTPADYTLMISQVSLNFKDVNELKNNLLERVKIL